MKNLKIKNVNELKKLFESYGYYPTEEILFEAYLGLKRFGTSISQGQDIYAVCLDGPAGAGKSSFIDVYKKTAKFYYDEEIEVIKYECNDTTGSSELIEEVGMVAVVTKNEEKIIIPGAIAKAIQRVNEGKKVILFIDEFDKSRKETDVFFYGFLQSGEINAKAVNLEGYSDTAMGVADKVLPSIVGIEITYNVNSFFGMSTSTATGSGIIISEDRIYLNK